MYTLCVCVCVFFFFLRRQWIVVYWVTWHDHPLKHVRIKYFSGLLVESDKLFGCTTEFYMVTMCLRKQHFRQSWYINCTINFAVVWLYNFPEINYLVRVKFWALWKHSKGYADSTERYFGKYFSSLFCMRYDKAGVLKVNTPKVRIKDGSSVLSSGAVWLSQSSAVALRQVCEFVWHNNHATRCK